MARPAALARRPSGDRVPGRRRALAAAPLLLLAGCGFKLRGATELPFSTFYTALPQSSQLGGELRRSVRINGATVVDRREDAQVRFDLLGESVEQEISALSTSGRPREYQLRYRLRWAVRDAAEADLIAPSEMLLRRLITVLDVQGILNADEVALLYRDMRLDAVAQILRRLSTLKRPA
jgi:LPS-assembly lipoprotein